MLANSFLSTHRNSYWKLNNSVLKHKVVTEKIHFLIKCYWQRALNDKCFQKNWELLKFEIAKYLRQYGSSLAKLRKEEETKVITKIATLTQCMPEDLTEDDKQELTEQQLKLDEIYRVKAEGAYVSSRKQWLEEGEQNTAYFFRLEKSRSRANCIQKLNIDGAVTDDPQKVSNHCLMFYRNLYKSQYDENATEYFFGHLSQLKSISFDQGDICDKQVTLEEVRSAIQQLKLHKSPGTDGLTSESYITFFDKLAPFLHGVFTESIHKQTLPPTLYQGLLTLIPKPNKDSLHIDNWRPICLLNNDYKILAGIFAKRLKAVLDDITDETQTGFMKGRHISNNIRLVLDLIDYAEYCPDDCCILFLDFCKAFDTIEHKFMFQALQKFGFGKYFCSAMETMYKKANSSIKMHTGTSPRFDLGCGIRQGCPVSPYLFLICAQLLSDFIKQSPIKGISIADREILISQLADDTSLFLKNASQISVAINRISVFSRASGLHLNLSECELLPLKNCNSTSISNIPVKESVTYLGITINKNTSNRSL